jgi:hypothetical protein
VFDGDEDIGSAFPDSDCCGPAGYTLGLGDTGSHVVTGATYALLAPVITRHV